MHDHGAAMGNELLGVHASLGCFGLKAQNLKAGLGFAVDRADGRTSAAGKCFSVEPWPRFWVFPSLQLLSIQWQSVEWISSVTTVKCGMDGIHRLFHLIRSASLSGALGDRHGCAVDQPFVRLYVCTFVRLGPARVGGGKSSDCSPLSVDGLGFHLLQLLQRGFSAHSVVQMLQKIVLKMRRLRQ